LCSFLQFPVTSDLDPNILLGTRLSCTISLSCK
jgi:hypothetical protein